MPIIAVGRPTNLALGCIAKDKVTNFTGVVIAITEWLNGCQRVTIQPQELKDGSPLPTQTFDAEQVAVVEPLPVADPQPSHGGPSISPTRPADPR